MKHIFFLIVLSAFSFTGFSQISNPVEWSFSSKKISATTYEITLSAKVEDDWHIYSQTTPDGGPVPTSISFVKNPLVTISGPTKEKGKLEQHFEKLFGVQVKQFSDKVDFIQTVTVKPGVKTSVSGTVEYMTCNDHECMPPVKQKFTVAIN